MYRREEDVDVSEFILKISCSKKSEMDYQILLQKTKLIPLELLGEAIDILSI